MKLTRPLVMAAVTLLLAVPAMAQNTTVRGRVVDAETGQPLAGATVRIGSDQPLTTTSEDGTFTLRNVPPGTQFISARTLGYVPLGRVLTFTATPTQGVEFALRSNPVQLAAIVATANRFERRAQTYTGRMRVLGQRDLTATAASDMQTFLRDRMGLQVFTCAGPASGATERIHTPDPSAVSQIADGSSRVRQCVVSHGRPVFTEVFIDEVRRTMSYEILAGYSPMDIARVEVYEGGQQIRVYTRNFMEWAVQHNYKPAPVFVTNNSGAGQG
jgi:hypothetical protein